MPDDSDERDDCPGCEHLNSLVVLNRFGFDTHWCPDCEKTWDTRANISDPSSGDEGGSEPTG